MYRYRLKFGRGATLKYLGHLDLQKTWVRAFRRVGLPLAYSEGFNPHPRLSLASPLPVGVTSEGEWLDLWLEEALEPWALVEQLRPTLPPGLPLYDAQFVRVDGPSLQSEMVYADYHVGLSTDVDLATVEAAVERLLAATELPRTRSRPGGKVRQYDLRPQIIALRVEAPPLMPPAGYPLGGLRPSLWMRLRNDAQGAGRPDEVTDALGLGTPRSVHRLAIGLSTQIEAPTA